MVYSNNFIISNIIAKNNTSVEEEGGAIFTENIKDGVFKDFDIYNNKAIQVGGLLVIL